MDHHEPFKALGPTAWDSLNPADFGAFLDSAFADANIIVNSIPPPAPAALASRGPGSARARGVTEPPALADLDQLVGPAASAAQRLRKEWKEVKVSGADDAGGTVRVYKLAAKDGKGSWFARASRHEGLPFEKWRLGLEREFGESLRANSGAAGPATRGRGARGAGGSDSPPASAGTGIVRSIGAERRVEREIVKGKGTLETYQLSARFPGPTTPRDFVVLLLTSASPDEASQETTAGDNGRASRLPRQFMILSKPCTHPACPPRQGFIRGHYESVETIREVPVSRPPLRKIRSSVELRRDEGSAFSREPRSTHAGDDVGRKAILRSAERAAGASHIYSSSDDGLRGTIVSLAPDHSSSSSTSNLSKAMRREEPPWADREPEMAIEWLMVTRSDPGGSVPRFMVEKGTPGGIVADTGRFIRWLESKTMEELAAEDQDPEGWWRKEQATPSGPEGGRKSLQERQENRKDTTLPEVQGTSGAEEKRARPLPVETPSYLVHDEGFAAPATGTSGGGFYDVIAGALGAAGTVASRMASFALPARNGYADEESSDMSDASSISSSSQLTFASAATGTEHDLPASLEGMMKSSPDFGLTGSGNAQQANLTPKMSSQNPQKPLFFEEASIAASDLPAGSVASEPAPAPSPMFGISKNHERDLQKLQERRQKVLDKIARAQERAMRKGQELAEKQKQKSNKKKQQQSHSNNSSISIAAAAAAAVTGNYDGGNEQAHHGSANDSSINGTNDGDNGDLALTTNHNDQNHDKKAGRQKQQQQQQKDALARLHEKHERERAKQEERYLREVRRLEEKRKAEERKAEERRRRKDAREREMATRLRLEKAVAERDAALREMDILQAQVGALQAQNTMLVARLGRLGVRVSADGSEGGGRGGGEEEKRMVAAAANGEEGR